MYCPDDHDPEIIASLVQAYVFADKDKVYVGPLELTKVD